MQLGRIEGQLRSFDLKEEKANQELVLKAIQASIVASAHDCAEGGIAVALAESAFANELGLQVTLPLKKNIYLRRRNPVLFFQLVPSIKKHLKHLSEKKPNILGK